MWCVCNLKLCLADPLLTHADASWIRCNLCFNHGWLVQAEVRNWETSSWNLAQHEDSLSSAAVWLQAPPGAIFTKFRKAIQRDRKCLCWIAVSSVFVGFRRIRRLSPDKLWNGKPQCEVLKSGCMPEPKMLPYTLCTGWQTLPGKPNKLVGDFASNLVKLVSDHWRWEIEHRGWCWANSTGWMWEICDQISSSCAQLNVAGAQKVFETSWECLATVIFCCFGQMRSVGAQQLSPVLQIHWGHHFPNRDAGWSSSYNLCFLACQQAVLQDVATWNCPPQFEHWQFDNCELMKRYLEASFWCMWCIVQVMEKYLKYRWSDHVPSLGPPPVGPDGICQLSGIQVFKDPRLTFVAFFVAIGTFFEKTIPTGGTHSIAAMRLLCMAQVSSLAALFGANIGGTWWYRKKRLRPMGGMWWTPSIRSCPTRTAEAVMGF